VKEAWYSVASQNSGTEQYLGLAVAIFVLVLMGMHM